jgi:hypothetical protein
MKEKKSFVGHLYGVKAGTTVLSFKNNIIKW